MNIRLKKLISLADHPDLLSILLLALLTALFMWRVVFGGQVLFPLDMIYTAEPWHSEAKTQFSAPYWNPEITDSIWQFLPMANYAKKAWQAGIPLWDPQVLSGMPGLAHGEMFSNPVFLVLSLFLPIARAISWVAVFDLFIAGLFTFLFLRELEIKQTGALIGALTFMFNGYLINWLSLPDITGSMVWLPMIFWGGERAFRRRDWRWALVGALGFAIQILFGSILWPFYGAVTLVLLSIYRGGLLWFRTKQIRTAVMPLFYNGLSLILGAALVAPQLLLTVELFFHTQRTQALGEYSFLKILTNLPRLIAPDILGTPVGAGKYHGAFVFTETNIYFGVLALFLLLASPFSKKKGLAWGFGGLGLVVFLAVYNIFPFRQIITILYPVFLNVFPARIYYVVAFTWAIAIGIGADWIIHERPIKLLYRLGLLSATLAIIVLVGFGFAYFFNKIGGLSSGVFAHLSSRFSRVNSFGFITGSIWLGAAALLLWSGSRKWLRKTWFAGLAIILVAGDLFFAGINYNPAFDPKLVFPETPSIQYLQTLQDKVTEPFRIVTANSTNILPGMVPEFFDFSTISGYSSWILKRYAEYADLTGDRIQASINHVYFGDCCSPLINALNVRYVYASPGITLTSSGTLSLLTTLDSAQIGNTDPTYVHPDEWIIDGNREAVLFEHPPARISYTLEIRKPVSLTTALSISPDAWEKEGDGVQFNVYAKPVNAEKEILLFSRYIDPKSQASDRAWILVTIDLSQFVGQKVVLTLETTPGPNGDVSYDWAGWADPQIRDYQPATLKLIYDGPNKIYENEAAFPRAWFVHRITQVSIDDINAVKDRLSASDFDPAQEAVVEIYKDKQAPVTTELGAAGPDDYAHIISYSAERVIIDAQLKEPGLLVLSDTMYPGWQAYVDGSKQPILTTDLILRGVRLESGNHQIIFLYRPPLLTIGLIITAIGLLVVGAAFILRSRKFHRETIELNENVQDQS
jgi:hypothetical protein